MADMVLSFGTDCEKREPNEMIEIINAIINLFIDAIFKIHIPGERGKPLPPGGGVACLPVGRGRGQKIK
jgi:hypothetical protein